MSPNKLPVIPATIMRKHQVHDPFDDRFRACARLLQALWREEQGLPVGGYAGSDGVVRALGSRIAEGAATGRNFLSPAVAQLAWQEAIYREAGAVIDEDRLWSNLLSSQPLTFNVMGPLRLNFDLATAFLHAMCPDLSDATVTGVLFEHSPGRGDPTLTGDYTAFDALIAYRRADERTGFIAFEFKYSENCQERQKGMRLSCRTAMVASQLFIDPSAAELQAAPLQQLAREHVLAQTMIMRGDYSEGRFVVVTPELNPAVCKACKLYSEHLLRPTEAHVGFEVWTLEAVVGAMREHVSREYAEELRRRYLAWEKVERAIESTLPAMPEIKRLP